MSSNNFKKEKGFTLIELLVVVSIIGLFSSIVLVSMQDVRSKARNARRLNDMNAIAKSIQLYFDRNGQFPARTADSCCDGWDQGPCVAPGETDPYAFIDPLKTAGILSAAPSDPSGKPASANPTDCYGYGYYVFDAGSYGCDASRGKYYVLGVRDMEIISGTYSSSPGFQCSGRNWQTEFEWVTGAYEKDF
jgi:prepilin-type N-terminal cleavage/methylation domain-containing protein